MAPVQSSYQETLDAGRAGALVNTEPKTLISRNAEAEILFGQPVEQGDNDMGVKPSAGGAVLGISVRERSADDDKWVNGESVRVMTTGVIWVQVTAAVVAGDLVHADGTDFTNTGGVQLANARYDSSAAAGALAKVRIS